MTPYSAPCMQPTKSYSSLELGTFPKDHNILTAPDGPHWKAVRQGITPAFSVANLKQVLTLSHVEAVQHISTDAHQS